MSSLGLAFRLQDDLDTAHFLRFEPYNQRMVMDRWPRPGDISFEPGFERPLSIRPNTPFPINIVLSDTLVEIYVAGKVAMSARMYKPAEGKLALFSEDGNVVLHNLQLRRMMKSE
jgi:beta-fructofuranosidase